ncbi:hypothetical protein FRC06_002145 [Ceratobasidium sp. 370]|nr:hypothetical protein FRC06_002145 [Ceratobasidium sp. 370]
MPALAAPRNVLTSNPDVQNMERRTPVKKPAKAGSSSKPGNRRFTEEEKAQLLENFDLEIADREARMRSNVADILARFLVRQENEVTRIPRALRSLTVGEFADKYDGSIAACLQGMAQARVESTQDAELGGKRKWQMSQNTEVAQEAEGSRAPKTARKAAPPSAVRHTNSRVSKTPSINRTLPYSAAPPVPSHTRPRLNATPLRTAPLLRAASTAASPFRGNPRAPSDSSTHTTSRSVSQPLLSGTARPPTSATFAPTLPPSAPAYPRRPRQGEQLLSANGSPLANPLDPDYDIPPEDQLNLDGGKQPRSPKPRLNLSKNMSSIRIRPSTSHSAASISQVFGQSQSGAIRHPSASSTSTLVSNHDFPPSNSSTLNSHSHHEPASAKSASSQQPHTPPRVQRSFSAVVLLPTTTGQVLEFDPSLTGPGAVDALPGISDSAKKKAKEEMIRFMTEAIARWNVGAS